MLKDIIVEYHFVEYYYVLHCVMSNNDTSSYTLRLVL